MSRRPATFTQADIARMLRAVAASGLKMALEVKPDGSIRLEPVDASKGGKVDSTAKWVP